MSQELASKKRAVVAGATGYLGSHVAKALHEDGWIVRALARDPEGLEKVKDSCDEVFVGEATAAPSLEGLFDGVDVAFSSIGIRQFKRRPTYEEVDYQANINLINAAEATGVRRFVFVSVLDGGAHREMSPLVDARERVVDRLKESSTEAVILRPTGFFNDMGDFFDMATKGKAWLIGSGKTRINPIHGADLARVAVSAISDAEPGREIPAGGPEVFSQEDITNLAFRVLDKPARYGHVNPGLLRFLAKLIRPFNKNASALVMMFSLLGDRDAVAPCYGDHRLEQHFQDLAMRARLKS